MARDAFVVAQAASREFSACAEIVTGPVVSNAAIVNANDEFRIRRGKSTNSHDLSSPFGASDRSCKRVRPVLASQAVLPLSLR